MDAVALKPDALAAYRIPNGAASQWPDAMRMAGFNVELDRCRSDGESVREDERRYPKGRIIKNGVCLGIAAHPGVGASHIRNPFAGADAVFVSALAKIENPEFIAILKEIHEVLTGLGGTVVPVVRPR